MANRQLSTKRLAIDKANVTLMIVLSIAAFISVFCLVASKSLLDQRSYQSEVISKKKDALDQVDKNLDAVNKLNNSYTDFTSPETNIIGGVSKGIGPRDGENPQLVIDALPSKYDFPALATSIENLLTANQYKLTSITGTDDEVAQSANEASGSPQAVDMPFSVDVTTTEAAAPDLLRLFERSIRPMQIKKLSVSGKPDELKITITAKTFYQPEKKLNVKTEAVN